MPTCYLLFVYVYMQAETKIFVQEILNLYNKFKKNMHLLDGK